MFFLPKREKCGRREVLRKLQCGVLRRMFARI